MRRRVGWRGALFAAIGLSLSADRRATLLTFASFAVRPAIPIAIAYLVKVIINAVLAHDGHALVAAAIGIAAAAALSAGSVGYAIELSTRMIEATSNLVDQRLMTLVGRLPGVAHLEEPAVLDRLEVLRRERVHLSEGADAFSLVLGTAVRAVGTSVLLAMVSPLMLLTPLLAIPSILASRRAQRRRAVALEATASAARLGRHLSTVASSPSAGKELRVFGLAEPLRVRYAATVEPADRRVTRVVNRSLWATAGAGLVFAAGYLGSLLLVLQRFRAGGASVGDVVLTLNLVTLVNLQISQAVTYLGFLQETVAASRRLLWLEDYAARAAQTAVGPAVPTVPAAPVIAAPVALRANGRAMPTAGESPAPQRLRDGLTLTGVAFRYPGGDGWALRDVDLHLPAGAVTAVVGANGAGKSTLIKLLAGLYQPRHGRILVDGVSLDSLAPAAWYARTSACFQDFVRLEFRARDSVGVGCLARLDDEAAIREAVEQGAAAEVIGGLPDGLDSWLGRSAGDGVELSGGQWQRIALARARMRTAPYLLLLDEPTAAIDPVAEDTVLRGYVAAARQTVERANGITLVASHRLATARFADLIVVVDAGSIVQVGSHHALMAQPGGIYRALYERQAAAYA